MANTLPWVPAVNLVTKPPEINRGVYVFNKMRCTVIRRNDRLFGYIELPPSHSLAGVKDKEQLNFVLAPAPDQLPVRGGITYAEGNPRSTWVIGFGGGEAVFSSWEEVLDNLEELTRQLREFDSSLPPEPS